MNRRSALLLLAIAPLSLPAQAKERFPVFASDTQSVDYRFRRREVAYDGSEKPGTIIVDAKKRYLYFILSGNRAMRYGVGVGKEGFGWSGTAAIQRKAEWPTWTPTKEALARTPRYEKFKNGFPGGPGNPLGARALYLYQNGEDTFFRIHGTVEPTSIGTRVSTGCIRMINVDVIDLYNRVRIGSKVVVLQ